MAKTLVPTKVMLNGKRLWLQDATEAEIAYLEYHTSIGTPLKLEFKQTLPQQENIVHGE